jgi:two-component system, NarL family, response regulator
MHKHESRCIRVLIADDHPVVRTGLTSMLNAQQQVEVIGTVSNGHDAITAVQEQLPDVLLLDLRMPGMDGLETLRALKALHLKTRVLILSSFEADEDIYRSVQEGAMGYLLKDTSKNQMLEAISSVHAGKRYIKGQIASRLAERLLRSSLTTREQEILEMIAKGLTNKQIASALNISDNTVRNHLNSIMEKLEVSDRTEAATTAIQQGIIRLSD